MEDHRKSVRIDASLPDGTPLASWTTDDAGHHRSLPDPEHAQVRHADMAAHGTAREIAQTAANIAETGQPFLVAPFRIVQIAQVCHEANRVYCAALGDASQRPWSEAPDWQKRSVINGVEAIAAGRVHVPEESHRAWLLEKVRDGWRYGVEKNPTLKTHPCLKPFDELSPAQQTKDYLFFTIATTLLTAFALIDGDN